MQNLAIKDNGIKSNSYDSIRGAASVEYPLIRMPLLLLFCGYVLIWYLQIGYRIPLLGTIRFELLYAVGLTLLVVIATPKFDISCPLIPYIVLYVAAMVVQIPFSSDFDTSCNVFIDRIIKFAFMSFFIIGFVRSPSNLKYFLGAFLLACLKMGQEGLVGRLTGALVWENQGILRLHGATPNYAHPNSFAGMALGTLPFLFYLWPLSTKYIKIVLLILAVLSLNIILFSASRTGYVGLSVFLACIFVTSKNKKKFMIYFISAAIVCLPLIPGEYVERFDSIFTGKDKEGQSLKSRKEILSDAWQIFQEHPLGVGISAFPKVRMERFGRSQDTHNLYLEIATNLGIQGFIVVLVLLYKLLAILKQVKNSAREGFELTIHADNRNLHFLRYDLKLIEAVASATITFVLIRLALGFFGMDLYEIYWWFAIGITFAIYTMMMRINTFIQCRALK